MRVTNITQASVER